MYIPSGYIEACQVFTTIWGEIYEFLEEFPWVTPDFIEQGIGRALASGAINAQGWDYKTGELHPIPAEFWRTPAAIGILRNSEPQLVSLPFSNRGRAVKVRVIMDNSVVTEFAPTFIKSSNPNPEVKEPNGSEASAIVLGANPGTPNEPGSTAGDKNKGGRNPTYDWEAFFIEAALYADLETLEREHWAEFQKHMHEWCSEKWRKQPDPSLINKKLKLLRNKKEEAEIARKAKPQ